jgi:hypothetical protein
LWIPGSEFEAALLAVGSTPATGWTGYGIDAATVTTLRTNGFTDATLGRVFAHPDVLSGQPAILLYYRRLLSMSNKVFVRLFPRLTRFQARGVPRALAPDEFTELGALNAILAGVARPTGFSPNDPTRLAILAEGAAIDGDWRNQIGRIATGEAFEAILTCFGPGEAASATFVRGADGSRDVIGMTRAQRGRLIDERWRPDTINVGEYRIRFGGQRVGDLTVDGDITVARLHDGQPLVIEAAGEVKGSTDPANAMERWRLASANIAAMNRIRSGPAHRRPTTFYVGLVITENVANGSGTTAGMRELLTNSTLDAAFSIVKFSSAAERQRFRDFFRPQVGL